MIVGLRLSISTTEPTDSLAVTKKGVEFLGEIKKRGTLMLPKFDRSTSVFLHLSVGVQTCLFLVILLIWVEIVFYKDRRHLDFRAEREGV